jgi:hypothetical protein
MKNVILTTLAFSMLFLVSGCCTMKTVSCPDGRPVSVPKSQKCANKLYKDVSKEFSTSIKATVNVIDKVTVGLDSLGIGTKVVQLKDKLNNESIRMELILKTSYYGLLIDPCESGKAHNALLKDVTARNYKLEELRVQLQSTQGAKGVNNTINDFEKNYQYLRGQEDGKSMGALMRAIDDYYAANKRYPKNIEELGSISNMVSKIGTERLIYFSGMEQSEFRLSFAGEDNQLGTPDDKRYKGTNGHTEKD